MIEKFNGGFTAAQIAKHAKIVKKNYAMPLDTLIEYINEFYEQYTDAGLSIYSNHTARYMRGYLLKCDEIYREHE